MSMGISSLQIAVLGAGKIGSGFAFQLARVGCHAVTVIARPGSLRLQQLQRDNAIVNDKGEHANVHVSDTLDEKIPYDILIVTLLAHQAETVLPTLQRSAAKSILCMFNTFHPERLQEAIGTERCFFGMPFIQATFDAKGRFKATIGAGGQKTLIGEQRFVDIFNAAGLAAAFERNMTLWLRCHVPLCVAFESISVSGELRGGGASWKQSLVVARGVHESFSLIKGLGYQIYPKAKNRIAHGPLWVVAAALWFMSRIRPFRELLATGKNECVALVDAMVAAAPLSQKTVATAAIQAMQPS